MLLGKNINTNFLKKINIKIEKNTLILGPSGSGKTTLLKILGVFRAFSGELYLDNRTVFDYPFSEFRKKITLCYHNPIMFDGTVLENAGLNFFNIKHKEEKIKELLKNMDIREELFYKKAKIVSAGEKQRINLVRYLLLKPKILLLDEPTANLDYKTAQKTISFLFEYAKQEKMTLVTVMHGIEFSQFFEKFVFLKNGEIFSITENKEEAKKIYGELNYE